MKEKAKSIGTVFGYLMVYLGIQLGINFIIQVVALVNVAIGMEESVYYELMNSGEAFSQIVLEMVKPYTFYVVLICDLMVLGIIWLVAKCRKQKLRDKIWIKKINTKIVGLSVLIGIGVYAFNIGVVEILGNIELFRLSYAALQDVSSIIKEMPFAIGIMIVGIIAPFIEEVLFRGIIFQALKKNFDIAISIVVQGLIFGLVHMNGIQVVYATLIGIVCGYVVYRTGSIWSGVIIHIVNNCISCLCTYMNMGENGVFYSVILILMILGVGCIGIGIYSINRVGIKNKVGVEMIKTLE